MWRQSETNLDEGGELTKRCQKNRLETERYPALCPRDGPFRSARAFGMETDARNGLDGGNRRYTRSCREPKMEIPDKLSSLPLALRFPPEFLCAFLPVVRMLS